MKGYAAGLRNNLRCLAYHILKSVDAWIDGYLSDAGCAAYDGTRIADTLKLYVAALDNHVSYIALQVTAPVNVAYYDLRC